MRDRSCRHATEVRLRLFFTFVNDDTPSTVTITRSGASDG